MSINTAQTKKDRAACVLEIYVANKKIMKVAEHLIKP